MRLKPTPDATQQPQLESKNVHTDLLWWTRTTMMTAVAMTRSATNTPITIQTVNKYSNTHSSQKDTFVDTRATFKVIWGGLRDLGSIEPNQCKPNLKHLQAVSCKGMCIAVSWSRWGLILYLLGSSGSFWVGNNVQGRNLSNLNF